MNRLRKFMVLLAVGSLLAIGCTKESAPAVPPYTTPLQVGAEKIFVEVVDNDITRERGLSGRERLTSNQGMLFDFSDTPGVKPAFWMKGMRFGLDFIWIRNGKIIGITPNAPVETPAYDIDYTTYSPPEVIDAVLEVNAGWASQHGIKAGQDVKF